MNNSTESVNFKQEQVIKLESHSWRNSLTFHGIPEEKNESSAKTESLLYSFLEDNLK